ncbi:MAG: 30S ribosomal protein S21 [Proteobacteria bacterium]|nr:30S ribosomal protein S21 [Pseudomonadota bacterium]
MGSLAVRVQGNDIEKALRQLKKKIQSEGLFRQLKMKNAYEKPSESKRRKWREAERRRRQAVRKKR